MSTSWTDAELRILTIHYADKGPDGIKSRLPRRSRGAIIQMAHRLNARWKVHPTSRSWTPRELKILAREFPKGGAKAVHAFLPHRPINSCRVMARKHGIFMHGPRKKAEQPIATKQDNRPLTFEEKLALVASGKASIAPALVRHHLTPTIREAA